jgi:hypothetical protein
MHSRLTVVALVLLVFAAVPAFALPPNLVKGGTFDTSDDLQKWTITTGGTLVDWEGVDGQARAQSGSATVRGRVGQLSQCIAITPGREYDFGARVLVTHVTRRPLAPSAFVRIDFMPTLHCGTVPLATAVTSCTITAANGRFTALSARTLSPDQARTALVTLVGADELAPVTDAATVLFDDVFVQERGGCVPDGITLCLSDGRFSATATYFDAQNQPHPASVVQLSVTSGYFYTYSQDDAELTIKTDGGSGKGFVIGGMTNLRLEIVVKDWTLGQEKRFANPSQHFLSPIVDAFPAE